MDNLKAKYGLEYAGKIAESTAVIVTAWLAAKGPLRVGQMSDADVIKFTADVRATLAKEYLADDRDQIAPSPQPIPAVNPKHSIQPDHIVCLEDGLKFKSLKRHLTKLGLTPETYREKWDLPKDYPMVAPAYAAQRSKLAKEMGLGRRA